ncbi:uncharacterized protein LOC132716854 [Ruditapes philippinarum]|uniref:uncharacterized protein LOC132716854 n=1 Tax=Ruditapes philippinarum TaxID=129788 RepID=UPI00295B8BC6|nr:uncharacterized protein LOC132716854 [Ruditapes philippinarum]
MAGSGFANQFMASTPGPSLSVPNQVTMPHSVIPKIPCFSGDEPLPKGEVPYVVWRYEVQCLLTNPDLTRSTVLQIIRGSLRGTARIMTVPLGQNATVKEILGKLDVMFSEASTKEDLLTQFFNSRQNPNESVTTYACRLETLLQSIIDKGQLPGLARNDILRHKFWTGLCSDMLKFQTRHKYDSLDDYNLLVREIRKVEKETSINPTQMSSVPSTKHTIKHTPLSAESSFEQQLSALENKLDSKITNMESKLSSFKDTIEANIDSKFNLILQKLENRSSNFRSSSHNNFGTNINNKSRRTQHSSIVENLIGPANEQSVIVNGNTFKCLLDSGSMVSTISQSAFETLNPKATLKALDSLGLTLSIADGSSLKYSGYIEATICVPFLSSFNLDIPILVIPDNDFNISCPIIIGTNVLRRCKMFVKEVPEELSIPEQWQMAMDSIDSHTYPVKVCGKKSVKIPPFESITLNDIES